MDISDNNSYIIPPNDSYKSFSLDFFTYISIHQNLPLYFENDSKHLYISDSDKII